MNPSCCKNQYISKSIQSKKYVFRLFPFNNFLKCNKCGAKHNLIFLFCTPNFITYITSKRIPMLH